MNTQTPQSLDDIFEEGRKSEMEKLSNWFKSLYQNLTSEQMLVAKEDFLQKNANAFCNEFNQGSRYKDALWEVDQEFNKNKTQYKFATFSATFEYTKDDFLIRKYLVDNRLSLFVEFFEVGLEKISFDLGRKQAWKDFGFLKINTNELQSGKKEDAQLLFKKTSNKKISEDAFDKLLKTKKKLTKFLWKEEDWNVLKRLHTLLMGSNYISSISLKDFEKHFKGKVFGSKIVWKKSKEELLYLLDHLTQYMESSAINNKGTVNPWFAFHFLVNESKIDTTSAIYEARRGYKNTNRSKALKDSFKLLDSIIQ